jgi:hypothetical protein
VFPLVRFPVASVAERDNVLLDPSAAL